jgi:hypothetical protein
VAEATAAAIAVAVTAVAAATAAEIAAVTNKPSQYIKEPSVFTGGFFVDNLSPNRPLKKVFLKAGFYCFFKS